MKVRELSYASIEAERASVGVQLENALRYFMQGSNYDKGFESLDGMEVLLSHLSLLRTMAAGSYTVTAKDGTRYMVSASVNVHVATIDTITYLR